MCNRCLKWNIKHLFCVEVDAVAGVVVLEDLVLSAGVVVNADVVDELLLTSHFGLL